MLQGLIVALIEDYQKGYLLKLLLLPQQEHEPEQFVLAKCVETRDVSIGIMLSIDTYTVEEGHVRAETFKIIDNLVETASIPTDIKAFVCPQPAVNYRGIITGDLGNLMYEIDRSHKLLTAQKLSIGQEYTFYNLSANQKIIENETVFVHCPLFYQRTGSILSLIDAYTWIRCRERIGVSLEKMISRHYFEDDQKYLKLGERIGAIIQASEERDHLGMPAMHLMQGVCDRCTVSHLPAFASLKETLEGEKFRPLLARFELCRFSGRPMVRDSTAHCFVIVLNVEAKELQDSLVCITKAHVVKGHLFKEAPIRYLIATRMYKIAPLQQKRKELVSTMSSKSELIIIREIEAPALIAIEEGVTCHSWIYKFGSISLDGHIKLFKQASDSLHIPHHTVVTLGLAPGTIVCSDPSGIRRLEWSCQDNDVDAHRYVLKNASATTISVLCSKDCVNYFEKSQALFHTKRQTLASDQLMTIEALVQTIELKKGSEIGLPDLSLTRSKGDLFRKYAIGLLGNLYFVASLLDHTGCLHSFVLQPNSHVLFPLELVPGAKVKLVNVNHVTKDSLSVLALTTKTVISAIEHSAFDPSQLYPFYFVKEIEHLRLGSFTLEGSFMDAHRCGRSCTSNESFSLNFYDGTGTVQVLFPGRDELFKLFGISTKDLPCVHDLQCPVMTILKYSTIFHKDYMLQCSMIKKDDDAEFRRRHNKTPEIVLKPYQINLVNYMERTKTFISMLKESFSNGN